VRKAQQLIDRPTTRAVVVTRAPKRSGRTAGLFAALGIVVALVAGGLYLRQQVEAAAAAPPPEPAVDAFLAAVFQARDPQAVAPTVCGGWYAEDALTRTLGEVGPGPVTWDSIGVVAAGEQRAIAKARVHVGQTASARTEQWRFNLVLEGGAWRVCEARPFTV
jgi:hypothetical protein